jgi:N-acetylglucosamine-6-phosphate deacetylase
VSSVDSMLQPNQILARRLFDGESLNGLTDQLIEIDHGRIMKVRAAERAELGDITILSADVVAPGFIDFQINGAGGAQFNFDPSIATLKRMADAARKGGTAHILPTFITAPGNSYIAAIDTVRDALAKGVSGILGLHLEGPFLSPQRPGIHDRDSIRLMTREDIDALTKPFPGPLLVTIAPECLPAGALQALVAADVTVFAGHSDASSEIMLAAQRQGLSGVTHLFNAMSQLTGREPGVVGSVLASRGLYAGIIADGHHVAADNLQLSARLLGDRLCLVTDAMLTLGSDLKEYELNGHTIFLRGGRLTNAQGTLAGAHIAMDESVRNMFAACGLPLGAVLNMASRNPAAALGLGGELGMVRPSYRASLTLLTDDLRVQAVVVDGLLSE